MVPNNEIDAIETKEVDGTGEEGSTKEANKTPETPPEVRQEIEIPEHPDAVAENVAPETIQETNNTSAVSETSAAPDPETLQETNNTSAVNATSSASDLEIKQEFEISVVETPTRAAKLKTAVKNAEKYLGIMYTLLSINFFALNSIIFKTITHIHPLNVAFWYSQVGMGITLLFMGFSKLMDKKPISRGFYPFGENKKTVFYTVVRGALAFLTVFFIVESLRFITPADLRTVVSAQVILVLFLGVLFMGEKFSIVPLVTAIIALVGIGIMTRPTFFTGEEQGTETLKGIGSAVLVMVLSAFRIMTVRLAGKDVNAHLSNFVVFGINLIESGILGVAFGILEVPASRDLLSLLAAGVCFTLAITLMVLALQRDEAGIFALVFTGEVVFVFLWQWVILRIVPDSYSVIGATLVVSGVVVVTLRKWVASLPENDKKRRLLSFILR